MIDNFKKIYDHELEDFDDHPLARVILSDSFVRMFVYEVCKKIYDLGFSEGETKQAILECQGRDKFLETIAKEVGG